EQKYDQYLKYISDYENNELDEGLTVDDIKNIADRIDLENNQIDDSITYQFETKDCKVIELGIYQENYKINNYNIDNKTKENIDVYSEVYDENEENRSSLYKKIVKKIYNVVKSKYGDVINLLIEGLDQSIPEFNKGSLQKLLKDKIIQDNKPKSLNINKYEYQYGLKSVSINYKDYYNKGIYISNPIDFSGNTKEIQLVTNEHNPLIKVSGTNLNYLKYSDVRYVPATSIEYYITNRKNPHSNDWYPILPLNYNNKVKGERIFIDQKFYEEQYDINNYYFIAQLRFPFKANSLNIIKNYNTEVSWERVEDKPNYIKINSDWNPQKNVYIAMYDVDTSIKNSSIVDFAIEAKPISYVSSEGKAGEVFKNPDTDRIELSYYPYIDYSKVNSEDTLVVSNDPDFNPTENTFNPNYKPGYRPIKLSLNGQAEFFINDEYKLIEDTFENDDLGIPFTYNKVFYNEQDKLESETVKRDIKKPYFYNITDYLTNIQRPLNKYNPEQYPIFEYLHNGKNIFFNNTFNSANNGQITVDYKYLIDGIRLKIIMRRNYPDNKGLTPILYDYSLKSRNFHI
ncbi:MAG: hypothetical protein ACOCRK_08775, partial [bacterium]